MFCRTVSDENSAPCWNRMPHRPATSLRAAIPQSPPTARPITSMLPPWRGIEPDDGAHQHRLAAAGSPDQAEDLALADVER